METEKKNVMFLFVGSGRWRSTEGDRHLFTFLGVQRPAPAPNAAQPH